MFQRNNKMRRFRRRPNGRNNMSRNSQPRMRTNQFVNSQSRNNFRQTQSAEKLFEKYNALAKEAISSGDKTLAENYLQHADHFERIVSHKNSNQNGNNLQTANINKEQNNNLSTDSTTNQSSITKNEE